MIAGDLGELVDRFLRNLELASEGAKLVAHVLLQRFDVVELDFCQGGFSFSGGQSR